MEKKDLKYMYLQMGFCMEVYQMHAKSAEFLIFMMLKEFTNGTASPLEGLP